jgi:hypothetical protein
MADKKITALTALTAADSTDLFVVVDDVSGTPTTKNITAANLAASIAAIGLNAGAGVPTQIHGIELPVGHTIRFEGATDNAFETFLTVTDPTADRTLTLPNETGTIATQAYADSAASTAAGAVSLDNLSDVTITSVSSGQLLSYNGSAWVNSAPVAAFNPVEAMVFM